jgi:ketosteroid isomerase-like protein
MSEENVEIVRRFYELSPQDDPGRVTSFFDPQVVVKNTPKSPEARTFVGYTGLQDWITGVQEAIADVRWEADDFIPVGEDRVLVPGCVRGRGRATDLPVEVRSASIFTLRDGRIVEVRAYDTMDEALEAAGLRE